MKSKRQQAAGVATDFDAMADSDRTPLDWARHTGRLDRVMEAIALRKQRQRRRRVQTAVGGASALLMATLLWFSLSSARHAAINPAPAAPAVVSMPERRTLPDGSVVELKDGSEIAVDFGGALRRVVLRSGEAHFQVVKNPGRAFVVEAGGMEFRAVGTAFAVQLSSTKVEMLVTEGTVAVERAAVADASSGTNTVVSPAASEPLALVAAGNQVAVKLAAPGVVDLPKVTPLSIAESGEKLAWRVPRLELNDTPLAEAIEAINRHSAVPLQIGDAELGKVGISGVLRADNVEPLLRMLESNYGIQADRREPGKILLRRGGR